MENSALSITDTIKKIKLSGKLNISGRVTRYDGHFLECDGFPANLGSICTVTTSDGTETMAEIIGFKKGEQYSLNVRKRYKKFNQVLRSQLLMMVMMLRLVKRFLAELLMQWVTHMMVSQ